MATATRMVWVRPCGISNCTAARNTTQQRLMPVYVCSAMAVSVSTEENPSRRYAQPVLP